MRYSVDLQEITVQAGQVLFVQPHQVRVPPRDKVAAEYFKITFDEICFSRLPRAYQFWLDPWEERRIFLSDEARHRLAIVFDLLRRTLPARDESSDLMIAYLNAVMSELENAYFARVPLRASSRNVEVYLRFQSIVENEFLHQPRVSELARALSTSETALYTVVKEFSGLSPKEYLNRRIITEAQRLLFYARMSVKELAHRLGFQDENYFSRFFRTRTGRSISGFIADLSRASEDSSLTRTESV